MEGPDKKITDFIKKHHVLTLATVGGAGAWCSNMFYAWIPGENAFVFTSDGDTRHAREMLENSRVAGSIVLETRVVGRIRGVQFVGAARRVEGGDGPGPRNAYLRRFPYAAMADLELWILSPSLIKFTDNTLGFGKKLIWHAEGGHK